jgi:hypothetical protein
LIRCFDDVIDVLVHVDPEDDEILYETNKPLTRLEVQNILDEYLAIVKPAIDDFRIHYLNGHIEVEVILPFAISTEPELLATLSKQCQLIKHNINKINNVILFFKHNED